MGLSAMLKTQNRQDSNDHREASRRRRSPKGQSAAAYAETAVVQPRNGKKSRLAHDRANCGARIAATDAAASEATCHRAVIEPAAAAQSPAKKPRKPRIPKPLADRVGLPRQELPPVALTAAMALAAQKAEPAEPYWLYSAPSPLPQSNALTIYRRQAQTWPVGRSASYGNAEANAGLFRRIDGAAPGKCQAS
jgi:hypothetical protein